MFAAVYGAGRKPYTKPDPRIFHEVVEDCGGRTGGDDRGLHHRPQHRAGGGRALHPDVLWLHPGAGGELGADMVLDDFADCPQRWPASSCCSSGLFLDERL